MCEGVSYHQPHECLLNRLFKAQINENIKASRHWPLWWENVSIRWRHHDFKLLIPWTMLSSFIPYYIIVVFVSQLWFSSVSKLSSTFLVAVIKNPGFLILEICPKLCHFSDDIRWVISGFNCSRNAVGLAPGNTSRGFVLREHRA